MTPLADLRQLPSSNIARPLFDAVDDRSGSLFTVERLQSGTGFRSLPAAEAKPTCMQAKDRPTGTDDQPGPFMPPWPTFAAGSLARTEAC
jgi:hypothetical protein